MKWINTLFSQRSTMKYLSVLFLFLVGCCPPELSKEPIVRIDTLRIYQPETNDTLILVQNDTIWTAEDPRYFIRIDTVLKKIFIKGKADTIRVPYLDTVVVYTEKKAEPGFFEGWNFTDVVLLFAITIVAVIIFSILFRR